MSVARSTRSLLGRRLAPSSSPRKSSGPLIQSRPLQSSASRSARRSRFRNVTAEKLGLLDPARLKEYRQQKFPEYTEEELETLAKTYTPEQMDAIRVGEAAVNPDDMIIQGRLREDIHRLHYVEDFTKMDPRFDVKPESRMIPDEVRWLNDADWLDEYGSRLLGLSLDAEEAKLQKATIRALKKVKESKGDEMVDLTTAELDDLEANPKKLEKLLGDSSSTSRKKKPDLQEMGNDEFQQKLEDLRQAWRTAMEKELDELDRQDDAENAPETPSSRSLMEIGPSGLVRETSAQAPELGKIPGVAGHYKRLNETSDEADDTTGRFDEYKRLIGMTRQQMESLFCKTIVHRFVANQTRVGKVRSISVMAIAGNGNGWLGIGTAKSTDFRLASGTAQMLAIRNMKPIRRYENRTIYGKVKAKVSGTVVELFNKPPGWGLRCPYRIFEICRAVGIHDIAARIPRSRNPMNSVKATVHALMNQPDPEFIALGRGKKMIDVRKVYYGGSVY